VLMSWAFGEIDVVRNGNVEISAAILLVFVDCGYLTCAAKANCTGFAVRHLDPRRDNEDSAELDVNCC